MINLIKKIFPSIETKIRKQVIKELYNNPEALVEIETKIRERVIKELYNNPEALVEIELTNKSKKLKYIWCEPMTLQIDLEEDYDYKIVTHDRSFGIEFSDEDQVVFLVNYSFGFKLYKRKKAKSKWILDEDYSEIN